MAFKRSDSVARSNYVASRPLNIDAGVIHVRWPSEAVGIQTRAVDGGKPIPFGTEFSGLSVVVPPGQARRKSFHAAPELRTSGLIIAEFSRRFQSRLPAGLAPVEAMTGWLPTGDSNHASPPGLPRWKR